MNRERLVQIITSRLFLGILASFLFAVLLAGTVITLQIRPPSRERRVFWFPDSTGAAIHAEFRFVPRRESESDQIRLYLQELVLGPARMGSVPFLPRGVRFSSIVLQGRERLFIDFSPSLVARLEEGEASLESIVDALEANVRHNFPFLEEITFTIGGQIPNVPRFGILALTKGRSAL